MTVFVSLIARSDSSSCTWLPRSRGNQKNRPAILNRLFAQQIDREGERVERGTAIVSVVVMDHDLNRLCRSIAIREVLDEHGRAVVTDDRNLVLYAADFDIDHQRERLAIRLLLKAKLLGNAIVCEGEIVGAERKDEFVALIANQGRHQHQRGVGGQRGVLPNCRWAGF
jgi:hypothetical protein